MRRLLLPLLGLLVLNGCQEITPPVIRQLPGFAQSEQEAKDWAMQRIRLGDLHLQAGYYDLAYENYWVAFRRWNQDFTPGSNADIIRLMQAMRPLPSQQFTAPGLQHSTISRIALSLELQQKYRLLANNFEYFASEDQADSRDNAVLYLIAAGFFYHQGGLDKYALPPLKKAISIDPSNLEAYQNLAEVSAVLEQYDSALSYWRMVRVISARLDPGGAQEGAVRAYYQAEADRRIAELEAKLVAAPTATAR
ncbi:MAG: hypothetical protein GEEBNDBF_00507 [bacterium]|nr:hypothetical protein [bacterium]